MPDIDLDNDQMLVESNGTSYSITPASIKSGDIGDDDLMLIERGGTSYSITGATLKSQLAGGGGGGFPDFETPSGGVSISQWEWTFPANKNTNNPVKTLLISPTTGYVYKSVGDTNLYVSVSGGVSTRYFIKDSYTDLSLLYSHSGFVNGSLAWHSANGGTLIIYGRPQGGDSSVYGGGIRTFPEYAGTTNPPITIVGINVPGDVGRGGRFSSKSWIYEKTRNITIVGGHWTEDGVNFNKTTWDAGSSGWPVPEPDVEPQTIKGYCYNKDAGKFICFHYGGCWTSTDGKHWTANDKHAMSGGSGAIATTSETWGTFTPFENIAYGNGIYVGGAPIGKYVGRWGPETSGVYSSTDGINWQQRVPNPKDNIAFGSGNMAAERRYLGCDVAFVHDRFLTPGFRNSNGVYESFNGISWSIANVGYGVHYNPGNSFCSDANNYQAPNWENVFYEPNFGILIFGGNSHGRNVTNKCGVSRYPGPGTTTFSSEPTRLNINGYYPLYTTEEEANSIGNGTSHSHTFGGVTYYMPNGILNFHGDYVEMQEPANELYVMPVYEKDPNFNPDYDPSEYDPSYVFQDTDYPPAPEL